MNPSILVIDDDENHRLLYSRALSQAGYDVETASCADDALSWFRDRSFSLAVVDIEMPGLDGLELLGRLRKLSPSTALVINSAYSTYKADFKSWVADGYVVKSSDLGPLKEKIRELLGSQDSE
ncbi:MAG: response regulator [candidate division Zixibacteria bacterium]